MARLPRYFVPDTPQHVILRGNNRTVIFGAEPDYPFFRDGGEMGSDPHGTRISPRCTLIASRRGEMGSDST